MRKARILMFVNGNDITRFLILDQRIQNLFETITEMIMMERSKIKESVLNFELNYRRLPR